MKRPLNAKKILLHTSKIKSVPLVHIQLRVCLSYFVVNKLTTYKTQNIFLLIVEHSGFIEYSLSKLD